MNVHLLGIGGVGVSALARFYLARSDKVSGCDARRSSTTAALEREGVRVLYGHDRTHVAGSDLVVYSTAVAEWSPELAAARRQGARVISRPEALAELISETESIAVTGTHGKTTTTYMIGHILTAAGRDPTVLVGDGASSRAGRGRLLVAEADESDGSLVLQHPRNAILTNVELDHPDHFANVDAVAGVFRIFLSGLPAAGLAVVCADDRRSAAMPTSARRVSYGFASDADYRCEGEGPFQLFRGNHWLGSFGLGVPGQHNALNACGAAAMCLELGESFETVASALSTFPGARRRLEKLGTWHGGTIYDDYGHHPTEVAATLQAARQLAAKRVVLVFQPHRYTRWAAFREDFARSFAGADEVIVTEIYSAGEPNPGGLTAAGVPGARFAPNLERARELLGESVTEGDLVLLMGAGDIRSLGNELTQTD